MTTTSTSHAATANSEDSGLIDIRTMTRMLGAPAVRPITPVPSFSGLAPAAPIATHRPTARPPTPTSRPSQTPLHVLLGVLVFGVVGLAGAVVHSATRTADAASTLQIVHAAPVEPVPTTAVDDDPVATRSTPQADPEGEPEAAEPTEHIDSKQPVDGTRKPRPAARPGKPEPAKPTPKPAPVAAVDPPRQVDDLESVACLLKPGTCGSKREAPPASSPTPVVTPGSDLPARLEPADISDGTRAAKASATSRCSQLAKGGEAVKIKLSIAGPTGAVLSTSTESDGGNPALATCCASELKAAQFRPVQKAQIGAVVTLKF